MSLQSQISALATRIGEECKSLWTAISGKCDTTDPRLSDAREWTADIVSQAEAEAGAASTRRVWTAQRVRQAIEALSPSGTPDGTIDYNKFGSDLVDIHNVFGLTIDWGSAGIYKKILGSDTTFGFANLKLNKVITVILTGNWVVTWPSYMDADHFLGGDDYDGTVLNYFQIHCTNAGSGTEEVWWTCKAKGS